VGGNYKGVNMF